MHFSLANANNSASLKRKMLKITGFAHSQPTNKLVAWTFRGKKNDSFFPLNFNVYINLDNRERAKAKKKKNSNRD